MLPLTSNDNNQESTLQRRGMLSLCGSTSRPCGSTTQTVVVFVVISICMLFVSNNRLYMYISTVPKDLSQIAVIKKNGDNDYGITNGNSLGVNQIVNYRHDPSANLSSDEAVVREKAWDSMHAMMKEPITSSHDFEDDANNKTTVDIAIEEEPSQIDKIQYPTNGLKQSTVSEEALTTASEVDFLVGGFAKCGTTSLLHSFYLHPETLISKGEYCNMDRRGWSDDEVKADLQKHLEALIPNQPEVVESHHPKMGIKCPTTVKDIIGLQRLVDLSTDIKIIIGLRHPVLFFESFYNYRVTENYEKHMNLDIPSPESLLYDEEWKQISTNHARYELSLMRLSKVKLNPILVKELGRKPMLTPWSQTKVFLYSIEQLGDHNIERSDSFRHELQQFLELSQPFEPFPHKNVNTLMKKEYHPEYIDICRDEKHGDLKRFLLSQAEETSRWILEEFVNSKDVVVGGHEYFTELLKGWKDDPCHQGHRNKRLIKKRIEE